MIDEDEAAELGDDEHRVRSSEEEEAEPADAPDDNQAESACPKTESEGGEPARMAQDEDSKEKVATKIRAKLTNSLEDQREVGRLLKDAKHNLFKKRGTTQVLTNGPRFS